MGYGKTTSQDWLSDRLEFFRINPPIAESILLHHERWNGNGYPQGLKGDAIPLLSRIIAIADTYDVLVDGRTYKKPIAKKEALNEIKKGAGYQFDPHLVEVFLRVMSQ